MPRPGPLQGVLQGRQLLLSAHKAGEPPRRTGLQAPSDGTAPTSSKISTGSVSPLTGNGPSALT